ncbi:MAG: c-type cytochrome, partial [Gemmataceae bacterium]|nr:c-type cytochrome [Gemmataceae bacterium]
RVSDPALLATEGVQGHRNAKEETFGRGQGGVGDPRPALTVLLFAAAPPAPRSDIPDFIKGADGLDDALRNLKASMVKTPVLSPREALARFKPRKGYAVDLIASEPVVKQPLHLAFDHRGRMWVTQYRQYPFPAGLKVVSYDRYIRAKFDKVPPPPPDHFKGSDRITIHEDVKGDGSYSKVAVFLDDLNIATATLPDKEGVWVMNPPYLLYYPMDKDDRPGRPVVHLSGFGLEDTHAVASSLTWGPDGWIYGAQGSTCTAKVRVKDEKKTTDFLGQAIWRYHPTKHAFELFAEGGGNTFGVAFDGAGRVYSGTNWGQYRGLHYVQGGYYVKGWGKHGPLTNPYALGFFGHMPHKGDADRLTHTFAIYDHPLMEELMGKIVGVNALQRRVQVTKLIPDRSTFRTEEEPFLLTTDDGRFRPVDVKVGPDGALYVADLYEPRINHVDPRDNWDKATGRIWRIRPETWTRRARSRGRPEVERRDTLEALRNADPHVRRWAVRLVGDEKQASPEVAQAFAGLAKREKDAEVRSQLASTAKRLPGEAALPILRELWQRDEDLGDPHIPLLTWWALESKAESDRDAIVDLLSGTAPPMVERFILERIMQRWAMAGGEADLAACARLLDASKKADRLLSGLEKGFAGRSTGELPAGLKRSILRAWERGSTAAALTLGLRLAHPPAVKKALALIAAGKADARECVRICGEIDLPESVAVLLRLLEKPTPLKADIYSALARYPDAAIGKAALGHAKRDGEAALGLLASRPAWAGLLLDSIDAKKTDPRALPFDIVHRLSLHKEHETRVARHFGKVRGGDPAKRKQETERVVGILKRGEGEPKAGKLVYANACAKCHKLFGEGGEVGPELTGYERSNPLYWLENVIDPSASIREEYLSFVVRTKDGRTLTGIVAGQDKTTVTLRDQEGQTVKLSRKRIEDMRASPVSIMPEGQLRTMTDQQVRDLFAYLMSPKGVPR